MPQTTRLGSAIIIVATVAVLAVAFVQSVVRGLSADGGGAEVRLCRSDMVRSTEYGYECLDGW